MKIRIRRIVYLLLVVLLLLGSFGCGKKSAALSQQVEVAAETEATAPAQSTTEMPTAPAQPTATAGEDDALIDPDGTYTGKEEVALYLATYGKLPQNFITKKEARALGWEGGSLEPYAPGKCIGGDYFGNYEELLSEKEGREYHECDIDTLGKSSRGAKRIVYSNDGLIYYTDDHYASFELLSEEE